jgi:tRNA1(Val) A37 N6-methylase TrmN6
MTVISTVTDDAFLGGRLNVLQPRLGYRAGLDAVMLAASVEPPGDRPFRVIDLGAGVGTAGLCVAARCPAAEVVLLEREAELAALARENVARNGLAGRVTVVEADIAKLSSASLGQCGLEDATFDHVIANPPYHAEGAGTPAQHALKAAAHAMPEEGLEVWCRALTRMAKSGGQATLIHKATALPELLAGLKGRFGALVAMPLVSHAGQPAIRIILKGVKGSRAPFRLDAGFEIHDADDRFTRAAESVLRRGLGLAAARGKAPGADAGS